MFTPNYSKSRIFWGKCGVGTRINMVRVYLFEIFFNINISLGKCGMSAQIWNKYSTDLPVRKFFTQKLVYCKHGTKVLIWGGLVVSTLKRKS